MNKHVSVRSIVAALVVVALPLACVDEFPLVDGTWSGASAQYPEVVFLLTQAGDSLHGSGSARVTGDPSAVTTPLFGTRHGDTIYVRGIRLPPSAGGGFVMEGSFLLGFGGRLTSTMMLGAFQVGGLVPSQILLERLGKGS